MGKETLEHANKASFLVLIILAALTTVAAMVFGMLDLRLPCYTAAGCSCIVTASLLFYTICKSRSGKRR